MKRRVWRPFLVLVLLTLLTAATSGCAWWNKIHTTQITVQVSGDRLLHLATVPRVLPDGKESSEQVAALLEEVAQRAGGYTYIEKVMGGWIPPGGDEVMEELNDLLLVQGPPEVAPFLRARLREDFQQQYPFVISLPIQSIAIVTLEPQPDLAAPEGPRP